MAEKIDQAINPARRWPKEQSTGGFRRYADCGKIVTRGFHGQKDPGRRDVIEYFVKNMWIRKSADFSMGRANIPFDKVVSKISFTKNPEARLRDHARHTQSNFIMNLMQSIFQVLSPMIFVLHHHILHVCWRPSQAWLGEIHFTQFSNAYTDNAGSFRHYSAGYSNGGAYLAHKLPGLHLLERWADNRFRVQERLQKEARAGNSHLVRSLSRDGTI
jgi:hypothetical protein